jgi:hypothetical protein
LGRRPRGRGLDAGRALFELLHEHRDVFREEIDLPAIGFRIAELWVEWKKSAALDFLIELVTEGVVLDAGQSLSIAGLDRTQHDLEHARFVPN